MNKIASLLQFDFIFLIHEEKYWKIIHSLLSALARSIEGNIEEKCKHKTSQDALVIIVAFSLK